MTDFPRLPGGGFRLPGITVYGNLPRNPFPPVFPRPPIWRPPVAPPIHHQPIGPIPGTTNGGFRDGDAARRQAEAARERARREAERARQEQARRAQEQRETQRRREEAVRAENQRAQLGRQEAERARRSQESQRELLRRLEADRQRRSLLAQREQQDRIRAQLAADARRRQEATRSATGLISIFHSVFGRHPKRPEESRDSSVARTRRPDTATDIQDVPLDLEAEAEAALDDGKRIGRFLPYLDEGARGEVPLDLMLGWIAKESSGRLDADESVRQAGNPNYHLDEVGPFQISLDERHLLKLRPSDRARILTDAAFSIKQGIRLAQFYQRALQSAHGVTTDSPAVWQLVKLAHKVGLPRVQGLLAAMDSASLNAGEMSWQEVKSFAATHPAYKITLGQMSRIDVVMVRGAVLRDSFEGR